MARGHEEDDLSIFLDAQQVNSSKFVLSMLIPIFLCISVWLTLGLSLLALSLLLYSKLLIGELYD